MTGRLSGQWKKCHREGGEISGLGIGVGLGMVRG